MAKRPAKSEIPVYHRGADVPMRVIRKFAKDVAERFKPDKIILFGSYAYGTPHADSDVDILVVMPCRSQLRKAVQIRWELRPPFSTDILVRDPKDLAWRLEERESFHYEIVTKGKVLYEAVDEGVGEESGSGLPSGRANHGKPQTVPRPALLPLPTCRRKVPESGTGRRRSLNTANP